MAGNIEQLRSGSWRLTIDVNGVRHRRTIPACPRRQAELELARLAVEAGAQLATPPAMTVGELVDVHLAEHTLAATTRADYTAILRRLPEDALDVPLAKVTAAWLDTLQTRLLMLGWTPHRVNRFRDVIGPALRRARRWDWIRVNPLEAVPAIPTRRPELNAPTPELVAQLLAAAEADPEWHAWLHLDAVTGARRGEVCGLRWGDIDLDRATVTIRRAVAYTPATGVHVKTTKTDRIRVVAVALPTVVVLRRLRTLQAAQLLRQGVALADDTYLFSTHPEGRTPWRPDRATQRFVRLCDRLGIEGVRLHDLRHAAATELLAAGVDVTTVANRLGHARTSTTLDRYAHAVPARDQAAAEVLTNLYTNGG